MRTTMRRILTAVVTLGAVGLGSAAAQQPDREQERLKEAERRVQEARAQLEEVIRALQAENSRDARRAMEESMTEMRRAMSELDRNRVAIAFGQTPDVGAISLVTSFSGPKMGVYLNTARDAAVDSIGAELSSVVTGGPADDAGLRAGDIITKANGESLARTDRRGVSPANKLIGIKDDLEVGDTLHVEYRRGSETRTADIVLDESGGSAWSTTFDWGQPNVVYTPRVDVVEPRVRIGTRAPTVISEFYGSFPLGWLDVELVTLDADLGRYFGTSEGLLVIRGSEEGEFDLRSGDVILNVDGRVPTSQSHLVRIMRSYEPGEDMDFEIMRDKARQVVTLQVPERGGNFLFRRPDWEF